MAVSFPPPWMAPRTSSTNGSRIHGVSLEEELLAAHQKGDGAALAKLYAEAADAHQGEQAAFYLTHAYVFALEADLNEANDYHAKLKSWGREE